MNDAAPPQVDQPLRPLWKRLVINLFWIGLVAMSLQLILIAFASRWWFADLFTHFRGQGFLLGVLLLVTAVAFRYWSSSVLLVLLTGVHAWVLVPYLPAQKIETPTDKSRTLLSWNVYAGNDRHSEIVSTIREVDADVVLLMEVSPKLGVQLGELRDVYPVIQISPSSDAFGIAVLSREPFAELTIARIGDELFNTVVAIDDDGVTFVGAHTLPPAGAHYSHIRNQQLQELADFVNSKQGPVIVAGDLNVSPWSPHFRRFIRETGLTDTRRGRGLLNSWPQRRLLTRIPIDHVLVTDEVKVGELKVLSDSHGSDHFPVFCRWEYESRGEKNLDSD